MALSAEEIRLYISDAEPNNRLLDGIQFSDDRIALAKKMVISYFNDIPPFSTYIEESFPSDNMLMMGVLSNLFNGEAALAARNQMSYSDGNLNLPIEERFEMYVGLSQKYWGAFIESVNRYKIAQNIEGSWGEVRSDYSYFPIW